MGGKMKPVLLTRKTPEPRRSRPRWAIFCLALLVLVLVSPAWSNVPNRHKLTELCWDASRLQKRVDKAFPEVKKLTGEGHHDLINTLKDAENAFAGGLRREGHRYLKQALGLRREMLKKTNEFLLNKGQELIYLLSLTVQEKRPAPAKRAYRNYLLKARQEAGQARQFYYKKHYPYSIQLLISSISYSLYTFQYLEYNYPAKYDLAWQQFKPAKPAKSGPDKKKEENKEQKPEKQTGVNTPDPKTS